MEKPNQKILRYDAWLSENEIADGCAAPEENIPGGLAAGKTAEDIAAKHGVTVDEINAQLEKGTKVEMEHTDNADTAREIAMDHLMEDPAYYDKLAAIEPEQAPASDETKPAEGDKPSEE